MADKTAFLETEQGLLLATFDLGDTHYALDTVYLQEVVLVGDITIVHNASDYIRGIINLRGKIITVIDLSVIMQVEDSLRSDENRIMIVSWMDEYIGLLVDRIGDVINLEKDHVEPAPANVREAQKRFISGIFREAERVFAILDIDEVLKDS